MFVAKLDCAEKSVVRFKFAFGVSAYALGRIAEVSVLETEHKIFRIRKNFFFIFAVFRRKRFCGSGHRVANRGRYFGIFHRFPNIGVALVHTEIRSDGVSHIVQEQF